VYETPEDEAGIRYKTVVEYSTNEEGKIVKKVKKFKVYKKKVKISKAVEARKVTIAFMIHPFLRLTILLEMG
jgi:hypothetical protein